MDPDIFLKVSPTPYFILGTFKLFHKPKPKLDAVFIHITDIVENLDATPEKTIIVHPKAVPTIFL